MTQNEQKPESAEFRTREAQKTALAEALEDGMSRSVSAEAAERHIAEVEARGAAEQRRKDTEGNKHVGYLHSVTMKNGETYESTLTDIENAVIYPEEFYWPYSITIEPVYTRPASVAALEARVKELEGALAQSAKRAFNHGYLIACCNISHLHDEPSIARDVLAECGLSAVDISAIELSDYDAKALAEIRVSRGDQDPIRSGEQL